MQASRENLYMPLNALSKRITYSLWALRGYTRSHYKTRRICTTPRGAVGEGWGPNAAIVHLYKSLLSIIQTDMQHAIAKKEAKTH